MEKQTIKTALLVFIALVLLLMGWRWLMHGPASSADGRMDDRPQVSAGETAIQLTSLKGSGLRFEGYYRVEISGQTYLMRFFEQGNVVLVNGPTNGAESLPGMLRSDAPSQPERGLHNVPVVLRNDSILFRTYPTKGEISYSGLLVSPDTVRLLKHSHINGRKALLDHVFVPDAAS